jgi:predicted RNA-binding Zn ribbon-like protein
LGDKRDVGHLPLLGGQLCLDFANTVDWRLGGNPGDNLSDYADLVSWSEHAGILSETEAKRLMRASHRSPATAAAVFKQGVALRELIYRIFSSIARGDMPSRGDVEELNGALSESLSRMRLVPTAGSFEWGWEENGARLERPLWYIVQSAATLLTIGRLDRIRQCNDDHCGWLFFDVSKNRSRRWCSMKDCGNRAKARRHYRKTRTGTKQEGEQCRQN